mmetsp:Transcript_12105/g.30651  ORF Transcript_12105/g.30651 Transcript_12105/m.30651 type:complete len:286 (+) Transcript_12105:132-989(+)
MARWSCHGGTIRCSSLRVVVGRISQFHHLGEFLERHALPKEVLVRELDRISIFQSPRKLRNAEAVENSHQRRVVVDGIGRNLSHACHVHLELTEKLFLVHGPELGNFLFGERGARKGRLAGSGLVNLETGSTILGIGFLVDHLKGSRQESLSTPSPCDFSGRRLGDGFCLQKDYLGETERVFLVDGSLDFVRQGIAELLNIAAAVGYLFELHHQRDFLPTTAGSGYDINRKCRGTSRAQLIGGNSLCRGLNILGIVIPSSNNNQILEAATNKQFFVVQKAEVTRS